MQYLAGGKSFTSDIAWCEKPSGSTATRTATSISLFPKLVANLNLRGKTEVEKQLRMHGMFSTVFIAAFQPLPCVSR